MAMMICSPVPAVTAHLHPGIWQLKQNFVISQFSDLPSSRLSLACIIISPIVSLPHLISCPAYVCVCVCVSCLLRSNLESGLCIGPMPAALPSSHRCPLCCTTGQRLEQGEKGTRTRSSGGCTVAVRQAASERVEASSKQSSSISVSSSHHGGEDGCFDGSRTACHFSRVSESQLFPSVTTDPSLRRHSAPQSQHSPPLLLMQQQQPNSCREPRSLPPSASPFPG